MRRWSPFNRRGGLKVVLVTDPWHKRLWARLTGAPVFHRIGVFVDDGSAVVTTDTPPDQHE